MSDERDARSSPDEEESDFTPAELEQARQLGERMDRALAGERPPVDQTLAAALMLRAAQHEQRLGPERCCVLVDQALAGGAPARRRSTQLRRWAPALALAASVLLVLGSFLTQLTPGRRAARGPALPGALQSRSSDALMGRPFEDRAGASRRLDLVFADRLSGYRQIRFGERSWR